jgi:hypothetical protein
MAQTQTWSKVSSKEEREKAKKMRAWKINTEYTIKSFLCWVHRKNPAPLVAKREPQAASFICIVLCPAFVEVLPDGGLFK